MSIFHAYIAKLSQQHLDAFPQFYVTDISPRLFANLNLDVATVWARTIIYKIVIVFQDIDSHTQGLPR
jgi:hypothetical protein